MLALGGDARLAGLACGFLGAGAFLEHPQLLALGVGVLDSERRGLAVQPFALGGHARSGRRFLGRGLGLGRGVDLGAGTLARGGSCACLGFDTRPLGLARFLLVLRAALRLRFRFLLRLDAGLRGRAERPFLLGARGGGLGGLRLECGRSARVLGGSSHRGFLRERLGARLLRGLVLGLRAFLRRVSRPRRRRPRRARPSRRGARPRCANGRGREPRSRSGRVPRRAPWRHGTSRSSRRPGARPLPRPPIAAARRRRGARRHSPRAHARPALRLPARHVRVLRRQGAIRPRHGASIRRPPRSPHRSAPASPPRGAARSRRARRAHWRPRLPRESGPRRSCVRRARRRSAARPPPGVAARRWRAVAPRARHPHRLGRDRGRRWRGATGRWRDVRKRRRRGARPPGACGRWRRAGARRRLAIRGRLRAPPRRSRGVGLGALARGPCELGLGGSAPLGLGRGNRIGGSAFLRGHRRCGLFAQARFGDFVSRRSVSKRPRASLPRRCSDSLRERASARRSLSACSRRRSSSSARDSASRRAAAPDAFASDARRASRACAAAASAVARFAAASPAAASSRARSSCASRSALDLGLGRQLFLGFDADPGCGGQLGLHLGPAPGFLGGGGLRGGPFGCGTGCGVSAALRSSRTFGRGDLGIVRRRPRARASAPARRALSSRARRVASAAAWESVAASRSALSRSASARSAWAAASTTASALASAAASDLARLRRGLGPALRFLAHAHLREHLLFGFGACARRHRASVPALRDGLALSSGRAFRGRPCLRGLGRLQVRLEEGVGLGMQGALGFLAFLGAFQGARLGLGPLAGGLGEGGHGELAIAQVVGLVGVGGLACEQVAVDFLELALDILAPMHVGIAQRQRLREYRRWARGAGANFLPRRCRIAEMMPCAPCGPARLS